MLTANYLTSVPDSELGFLWISVDENSGKEEILGEGKTFTLAEEHISKRIKLSISYKGRKYETKPLYIYGVDKATISVPEYGTVFANVKTFRQEKYPYSVTIESATGDTYSISASFGDKVYNESAYVPMGDKVTLNFESEPLNGYQNISVNVKNSAGESLADYTTDMNVLPPLADAYLAPFTRKLGLAGALLVSEKNDVAELASHRIEFTWATSETSKGKYNIDYEEDIKNAIEGDTEIIALVAYNNKLYNGKKSLTNGVVTKENIDGYAGFAKAIQKKYSENSPISYFEIWNEPNASSAFWKEADRVVDYVNLAEVSKRELIKSNPDEKTAIGAAANGDYYWIGQLLEEGLYPNMDAVSNHPYIWNAGGIFNYLVDEEYHRFISGVTGMITKYGGWKEQIITEVGWPTYSGGISKEQQAIELVKQVVVADYYDISTNQFYRSADDFVHDYYSADEPENNFGVFYHGVESLKPSAFSISNLNYQTTGAVFAGKLPFEDKNIEAYLYARDKEITCIIWTKGNSTTVKFEGENLTADDMFGNYICSGDTFVIGEAPIYIHGLSQKHIVNSLPQNIRDYIDLYIPLSFADCEDKTGFDEAKSLLYSTAELAGNLSGDISEADALAALENHYSVNLQLIDMYKQGRIDITDAQLNGLLFVNQWGANLLSVVYMLSAQANSEFSLSGRRKVQEAENVISEKAGENTLSYSEAILVYAEKFADKAEKLAVKEGENPQKNGAVKAWDTLSGLIAETASRMSDAETVDYDNVIIQLPSSQWSLESGVAKDIYVSVYNYRPSSGLSGKIELISPGGRVVATSSDFTVDAEKSEKVPVNVQFYRLENGTYKIRLIEDGKIIAEKVAKIEM